MTAIQFRLDRYNGTPNLYSDRYLGEFDCDYVPQPGNTVRLRTHEDLAWGTFYEVVFVHHEMTFYGKCRQLVVCTVKPVKDTRS